MEAKDYKIAQVQERGAWEFNGNKLQDFAVILEDDDRGWIKLTQQAGKPAPSVGQILFGTIESKLTKSGDQYWKFKKESKGFQRGGSSGISQEQFSLLMTKLDAITKMVEKLLYEDTPQTSETPPASAYDDVPVDNNSFEGIL